MLWFHRRRLHPVTAVHVPPSDSRAGCLITARAVRAVQAIPRSMPPELHYEAGREVDDASSPAARYVIVQTALPASRGEGHAH
jgi:hypothetical protein